MDEELREILLYPRGRPIWEPKNTEDAFGGEFSWETESQKALDCNDDCVFEAICEETEEDEEEEEEECLPTTPSTSIAATQESKSMHYAPAIDAMGTVDLSSSHFSSNENLCDPSASGGGGGGYVNYAFVLASSPMMLKSGFDVLDNW